MAHCNVSIRCGSLTLTAPAFGAMAERSSLDVPAPCLAARAVRDGDLHHLTLLSKDELRGLSSMDPDQVLERARLRLVPGAWVDLGLGRVLLDGHSCFFKVVFFPGAFCWRADLGLGPHDFHVTCGFQPADIHRVDKGPASLFRIDPDCGPLVLDLGACVVVVPFVCAFLLT